MDLSKARHIRDLHEIEALNSGEDRVYWGSESCEKRIPGINETVKIYSYCLNHGVDLSIVTPPVTQNGLEKSLNLLNALLKEGWDGEVIVNDLGMLGPVKSLGLEPVIGRFLMPVSRDPVLLSKLGVEFKKTGIEFQMEGVGWNRYTILFFKDAFDARRFEIQPSLENIDLSIFDETGTQVSVYSPFSVITRTRLCLTDAFRQHQNGVVLEKRTPPICNQPCNDICLKIDYPDLPLEIELIDNMVVFENPFTPQRAFNIDALRIVDNSQPSVLK